MADCSLCDLAARQDHALRLYQDDRAVVVLRLKEGRPTQVLVVPRHHAGTVRELGQGLQAHLLKIGMRAQRSLEDAGVALERLVPELQGDGHVHVRLVPSGT